MKSIIFLTILAVAVSTGRSVSAEDDTSQGGEVLLERLVRGLISVTIFYHPPDPYSCYTTKSTLYCTSHNYTLQVQSSTTVQLLKQLIDQNYKYPADLQVLKYRSQVLDNSQSLAAYDVHDRSLLDLTLSQIPDKKL